MTQATKSLALVFGISLVLVVLRFAFEGTGNSEALSSHVISFEKSKVNRIEIKNPERGNFTLQKTMNGWTVQKVGDEKSYAADENSVTSALDQIGTLKPKAILTRTETDFSRYQVDTTGTEVRLFDGSKELGGLVVGRFQFVSQQEFNTFVRNADSKDVVSVDGFIGSYFSKNLDSWRDKTVWNLDKKGIIQLDFVFPGDSSFTAKKVSDTAWMSALDTLTYASINQNIGQLAELKAAGFVYPETSNLAFNPLYKIVVQLDNGLKQELELSLNPEKESEYLARATGYDEIFTLNKSSLSNSILRNRKAYLKN